MDVAGSGRCPEERLNNTRNYSVALMAALPVMTLTVDEAALAIAIEAEFAGLAAQDIAGAKL
jgi:hypothetical protein